MHTSRLLPSLWASFDRLHGEMDRLLEGWNVELPRAVPPAFPPVNVWEDEEGFYLEAELPGMTREQLHISVTHRNHLTIQGELPVAEVEKGRYHRRERGFGRFQRTMKLPAAVDAERVEAKLENGLLQLTLPKAEEAKPRKIAVKAN